MAFMDYFDAEYDEYDENEGLEGLGDEADDFVMESQVMPPDYEEEEEEEETFIPEIGPIKTAVGIADDLSELAKNASTGDVFTIMTGLESFSKSQLLRFMDVTVIGPLLLVWAWKGKLSKFERSVLALIGVGTVIYNARNMMTNQKLISNEQLAKIKEQIKLRIG